MTADIKRAIAIIAEGCCRDIDEVNAWLRPLFDPDKGHRDTFDTLITVITRGFHGKVEVKLDKEGNIVDCRLPEGVKGEQLKSLMSNVMREPRG